ncbi:Response regulator [Sulfidibacter corallicola]|uniref:histidine kinase n=1 Tax=Sulfidibacter corallicola TaxID=2818388 RepID=A0A8A4TIX9_SULCO|nr:ATP-binding protein [Sulfidibacter corallicola]QTD49112.1 response regulator [Sulfidibacter corallicola]
MTQGQSLPTGPVPHVGVSARPSQGRFASRWFPLVMGVLCLPVVAQPPQPRFRNYAQTEGLSQCSINGILQDRYGFLWVGTQDGLNRFDGYEFTVLRHRPNDPHSLTDNFITALEPRADPESHQIWVGTSNGFNLFDLDTMRFTRYLPQPDREDWLQHPWVWDLYEDPKWGLFIATSSGGLYRLDLETNRFHRYPAVRKQPHTGSYAMATAIVPLRDGRLAVCSGQGISLFDPASTETRWIPGGQGPGTLSHRWVWHGVQDARGTLWLGTETGLDRFDPITETVTPIPLFESPYPIWSLAINRLNPDELWVATEGGGLITYHTVTGKKRVWRHNRADPFSIAQDSIARLHQDRAGLLWIGTDGSGLSCYDPRHIKSFNLVRHLPGQPRSLSNDHVLCFALDRSENLWVGTGDGLNRLESDTGRFQHFNHEPKRPTSLTDGVIRSLYVDEQDTLWVGTENGLNRFERETGTFSRFSSRLEDPETLSHPRVSDMLVDGEGRFWIATENGLNTMDRETGRFTRYMTGDPRYPQFLESRIWQLAEDPDRGLWLATDNGLYRFAVDERRFTAFFPDPDRMDALSHHRVTVLHHARDGSFWIGTSGGLNRMNTESGTFRSYTTDDGMANDFINGILEDDRGHLWISTNGGISRFDPEHAKFHHFDRDDGLQGNEFNVSSFLSHPDGSFFFGGLNGYNHFFPNRIGVDQYLPAVVLTEFLLFNQPVMPAPDHGLLSKPLLAAERLELNHRHTVIGFEFAALHFAHPKRQRYRYRLQGYDVDWIETRANKRFATYTGLPAGEYVFQVRASNGDGVWNLEGTEIEVHMAPAPWRTWWAYASYAGFAALLTLSFIRRQRLMLAHERRLNRLKDDFLANTSHEFRTPLNGIIGLAESLMDGVTGELPKQTRFNLALIVHCARRLMGQVNDVLDFAKLRHERLPLHCKPLNLHTICDLVLQLYQPSLGAKPLELRNEIDPALPPVFADEDRLQQILFHLLDNAVKFTEAGHIAVGAEVQGDKISVRVSDTGVGIPRNKQERLFRSFEQLEASVTRKHRGSGLGLALTKALVERHGGTIQVDSAMGCGSTFRFTLPRSSEPAQAPSEVQQQILGRILPMDTLDDESQGPSVPQTGGDFNILIVDDEAVNRRVLINHLSLRNYHLTEAADGQSALALLNHEIRFDLVLLDIMMPQLSGYEVCKRIRRRYSPNELPIIFLTARNRISDLVEGFASGANDYLTKPISKHELLARVTMHLRLLDVHRNLEQKVTERTERLEAKNQELAAKNAEIVRTQNQLIMKEKMASMGTLTGGLAHEIKNPLNFINNFSDLTLELLQEMDTFLNENRDPIPEEVLDRFLELLNDLDRCCERTRYHGRKLEQVIEKMLTLTGGKSAERQDVEINRLVDQYTALAYHRFKVKNDTIQIHFLLDLDPNAGSIVAVPQNLSRAIINVVTNAVEAILSRPESESHIEGTIWVRTSAHSEEVTIEIEDNGPGLADTVANQVFTPFFTTKPTGGEHLGLGLTLTYDVVVQEHAGRMSLARGSEGGCLVVMTLPRGKVEEASPK